MLTHFATSAPVLTGQRAAKANEQGFRVRGGFLVVHGGSPIPSRPPLTESPTGSPGRAIEALEREASAKVIQRALSARLAAKAARDEPAERTRVVESRRELMIWALLLLAHFLTLTLVALLILLLTAEAPSPTAPIVAEAAFRKVCLWDDGMFCVKLPAQIALHW